MRARLPLSALSLAIAASLVVAAPAAAAPFTDGDVTVGGTTWSINDFSSEENPYLDYAERDDWDGGGSTYDSGLSPVFIAPADADLADYTDLDCDADGDRTTATDGTGDEIVRCTLEPFVSGDGSLDAVFEQRFFSDGETVRSRLIVTNNSAETVSGALVGFTENYYQDDDTRLGASTTAGHPAADGSTTVDGDLLWVIYDAVEANDYEVPVVLTAAGTADAAIQPLMGEAAGDGYDDQTTLYPLPDLAPGETVEVVQFTVWNFFAFDAFVPDSTPIDEASTEAPADAPLERAVTEVVTDEGLTKTAFLEPAALFAPSALTAVAESWADRGRFDALSARDAAGIADLTAVLNWNPAEEQLAATGPADALPIAALSGLLLLAGATAVAVRRRRA